MQLTLTRIVRGFDLHPAVKYFRAGLCISAQNLVGYWFVPISQQARMIVRIASLAFCLALLHASAAFCPATPPAADVDLAACAFCHLMSLSALLTPLVDMLSRFRCAVRPASSAPVFWNGSPRCSCWPVVSYSRRGVLSLRLCSCCNRGRRCFVPQVRSCGHLRRPQPLPKGHGLCILQLRACGCRLPVACARQF